MARVPIEIATVSEMPDVDVALEICNSVQSDYGFERLDPSLESEFRLMDFRDIDGDSAIELADDIRMGFRGFHPFLIVVFRGVLRGGGWTNLFNYSSNGVVWRFLPLRMWKAS